ncbi:MAG: phosphodiester glycosidase family protein [Ruminococcaceae bacterium]|nr:phosphodiester glycosidase family protein [Oscillospiraceae bacterium]
MTPIILKESDYIKSCTRIKDGNRTRVVLRTEERAHYVTLTDADGRIYGEITNFNEPFDFTTHVFYLPPYVTERPMTVNFINYTKRNSRFFTEKGEPGQLTLSPETVIDTDRESFIAFSDHGITVEAVTETEVCDGIRYQILTCTNRENAPVRVYVLLADPAKAEFSAGTANDGYAAHTEIQTVQGQAEAAIANGRNVVAAVNADFFDMFGDNAPSGLCIKDGRSVSNANTMRSFFGMDLNGTPVISSYVESPELIGQLRAAVGGREIYLRDGELAELSLCEPFSYTPHPRTTVGIREDGTVILMVVDGRLPEISNGASLVDLAALMKYLGAKKAINIDGGGSSTFLVNIGGEMTLLNRPADLVRPNEPLIRPIFNSIQVIRK